MNNNNRAHVRLTKTMFGKIQNDSEESKKLGSLKEREKEIIKQEMQIFRNETLAQAKFDLATAVEMDQASMVRIKIENAVKQNEILAQNLEYTYDKKNELRRDIAELNDKKIKKEGEVELLSFQVEASKTLNAELEKVRGVQIKAIEEKYQAILSSKDEVIKLLTTQVEILTAKLTEIKISDAHIHVNAEVNNKE